MHYLGAHGLERHAARVLTIDRVGSQDSIGTGQSFGSLAAESSHDAGNDSRGEDEGEGDAAGGSGSSRAARAGGAGVGLPPLAPGSLARVGTHARVPRRAGSSAAGSDANITTSDGGTGTESEPGGEDAAKERDATPSRLGDRSLAVRRNQTPDFMPETPAPERSAVPAPGEEFVRELALGLRDALRLRLFNFDLIRVNGDGDEFLVVDINYFPGIAKMPGYCETFCAFLRDAKGAAARRRRTREGRDEARMIFWSHPGSRQGKLRGGREGRRSRLTPQRGCCIVHQMNQQSTGRCRIERAGWKCAAAAGSATGARAISISRTEADRYRRSSESPTEQ